MRKRVLKPPAPAVTTNGLCPADEKVLHDVLERLDAYSDRMHLLGAKERDEYLYVQARVKIRLFPPPIGPVAEAAERVIARYGPTLDAGRAATLRRDAELEEINAQRLAAREARVRLLAAKAAAKEEARLKARLEWQGKT